MLLVERGADLAALAEQRSLARTSGRFVLVGGESGAGKSTLVQAFVQSDGMDLPVLWGACDPLSTPRPLGPLHDVSDGLGEQCRALLSGQGEAHEIFAAVFEHLRREPTVLVVDDLHWADQGTIDLLRFVLRRLAATRSLVIGTARDDEVGSSHPLRPLLGDIARSPAAHCLDVRPLSVDAVAAMSPHEGVDPRRVHLLTGGNAFFVREVLEHAGEELPVSVRDAVLARTAGLDDHTRAFLELLACAPEGVPDGALAPLGVGMAPLRAADEAGLIRRGQRGVTFRHDLCRLAIADAIPPGGEAGLHRRLLDALEASGLGAPAVLVHHAVAAGDAGQVQRHARSAGLEAARSGAHTQAAAFFETALWHGAPAEPRERAELLELLAAECYLVDRLHEAIEACTEAMQLRTELGDTLAVSADHEALAMYEWYNANRSLAEAHASEAIAVMLGAEQDRARLGHAHAAEAYLALQASDVPRARELAGRAREIAAGIDDPALDVRLGVIDGVCDLLAGGTSGREAVLRLVSRMTDHLDEISSSGFSNIAYLDVEQRRLRDAGAVLEVSIPLTVERDVPICRVWQLGTRGRLHLLEGRWDDAVADADAVLAAPSAPLARTWPHLIRGLVALRRGEPADDDLDEAWALATRFGEPLRLLPVATAFVERAWLHQEPDERLERAAQLLSVSSGVVGLEWSRGELAVWLRRAGVDIPGDLEGELAGPHRQELRGEHDAAAATWEALAAPYAQAMALLQAGAPDATRSGLDLLDRLGADAVADRVRRLLRERGWTAVPARRRATTRANPAGLTARQVEVLALLDEGLTNAEIADRLYISPKTADHHVSAILTKLAVSSRREAARAGRRLGLLR